MIEPGAGEAAQGGAAPGAAHARSDRPPGRQIGPWRYLGMPIALVGGAIGWACLRPVPDWRLDLHTGVLLGAGLLLLVVGVDAVRRGAPRALVGGTTTAGCLFLLALAGGSRLANEMRVGLFDTHANSHRVHYHPDRVTIEHVTRMWGGGLADCSHRAYPIYLGMFLGPAQERDLGCG